MKVRCVFLILSLGLVTSCKEDGAPVEANSPWISTEEAPGKGISELDRKLQGTWQGEAKGCAVFGDGMQTLKFQNGQCTWNEFTQAYSLSNDTLFLAGMHFIVQAGSEKIKLKGIEEACLIELSGI